MRVPRNNHTLVLHRQFDKRNLKMLNLRADGIDRVSAPQPKIGHDLVVSAPSRVELLRRFADQIGQRRFDVHVHIFSVRPPLKLAVLDSPLDLAQPLVDAIPVGNSNQSLKQNKEQILPVTKQTPKTQFMKNKPTHKKFRLPVWLAWKRGPCCRKCPACRELCRRRWTR